MAIIPRYVEEMIDYMEVPGLSSISFPMTCFCDIPLNRGKFHSDYYGSYGIALDKYKMTKANDIQPVFYLNSNSRYYSDFISTFRKLYEEGKKIGKKWEFLQDFFLSVLLYSKPIEGNMRKGEITRRLFQDECEWRFIPTLPEDIDLSVTLMEVLAGYKDLFKSSGITLEVSLPKKLELKNTNRQFFRDILQNLVDNSIKAVKDSTTKIIKWDTRTWGEIPADFGRK